MLEWLQLIGLILLGVVVGNMLRGKFKGGG